MVSLVASGSSLKPVVWVGGSRRDLRKLPRKVRQMFGYAIYRAQEGQHQPDSKTLKGFGGGSVTEVVEDFDGSTFRAVYTTRFAGVVYVLHVFQKKSKKGARTPQPELELIRKRIQDAEADYRQRRGH